MDDNNVFRTFLQKVVMVAPPRALNAIVSFIPTLDDLLATTDKELNDFVTTTHNSNSAQTTAQKIIISPDVLISLQLLLFELKDRNKCNALPDQATIQAITRADLSQLRRVRTIALEHKRNRAANSKNTAMKIPKFQGNNYDEFIA